MHVVGAVADAGRDDEVVGVEVVVLVAAALELNVPPEPPRRRRGVRGVGRDLADVDVVRGDRAAEVGVAGGRRLATVAPVQCVHKGLFFGRAGGQRCGCGGRVGRRVSRVHARGDRGVRRRRRRVGGVVVLQWRWGRRGRGSSAPASSVSR